MTNQTGTQVVPDDLDTLGTQLDKAGDSLLTALGDPAALTGVQPEAFGPAATVVHNYQQLATQLIGHVNDAVSDLHTMAKTVHAGATGYREADQANAERIKRAARNSHHGQHGHSRATRSHAEHAHHGHGRHT